jgi:hypothetical protein
MYLLAHKMASGAGFPEAKNCCPPVQHEQLNSSSASVASPPRLRSETIGGCSSASASSTLAALRGIFGLLIYATSEWHPRCAPTHTTGHKVISASTLEGHHMPRRTDFLSRPTRHACSGALLVRHLPPVAYD